MINMCETLKKMEDAFMTYDLARKTLEAVAWDRLADAIESGDRVKAREALNLLRKANNILKD